MLRLKGSSNSALYRLYFQIVSSSPPGIPRNRKRFHKPKVKPARLLYVITALLRCGGLQILINVHERPLVDERSGCL
ncbi:hypothetical protein ILYODFUR_016554 [Ilyodon furcidens]|uniref:Uncharacterized protein n=1 Tax=Ilyodon furcidens TaxID=33524 RepID=A0ABV0VEI7_9TELE